MEFFKLLSNAGITDVIIQFSQNEKKEVTVFVAPKTISQNNPLKALSPIYFIGTAQKVDGEFFLKLADHLVQAKEVNDAIVSKAKEIKALADAQLPATPEPIVETLTEEELQDAEADAEADRQIQRDDELMNNGEEVKSIEEVTAEIRKERTEKLKAEKVVKVNNEKVLKDFMTNLGKDTDILNSVDAIEELYAKLSPEELEKPFAKKVRIDVDIRLRKQANYLAALEKNGFKPKPAIEEAVVVSDVPKEIQEIAAASPNVIIATVPGPEPEVNHIEVVLEEVSPKEPIVMPLPPPAPVPVDVYEDVEEFQLIAKDYTLEQYQSAGWTKELLISHGYAQMVTVKKLVVNEAPKSLSYTVPKHFDADDDDDDVQEEE